MKLEEATVLLVDDEEALLFIFERWFSRAGCRTLTAPNGAEALEILAGSPVDLIVSDIRMPVLDGVSLARTVKASRGYVPKIMFLSSTTDLRLREALDLGVEASLSKPVERQDLLDAAQRCLASRASLWSRPPAAAPSFTLRARFEGLAAARQAGLIAFGHGGFCVRSPAPGQQSGAIGLALDFTAESLALTGQGILRWTAPEEGQLGIEISHLAENSLSWVSRLAEENETASFIPRTSAGDE
jgi:CheY-like chemotaxis protein